ncbi:MAG: hypothetical protein HQK49_07625 [Oligoflexia bacterium]|nr:hypothetical protein [Oligoflexia bacterium]
MTKKLKCFLVFMLWLLNLNLIFNLNMLWAQEYKASLAQMPLHAESKDKGILVD